MDYNFDVKLVSGTGRWVVEIDSQANYGYFENTIESGEGGLWFDGKALVDYDGFSELPATVEKMLMLANYDLSDI